MKRLTRWLRANKNWLTTLLGVAVAVIGLLQGSNRSTTVIDSTQQYVGKGGTAVYVGKGGDASPVIVGDNPTVNIAHSDGTNVKDPASWLRSNKAWIITSGGVMLIIIGIAGLLRHSGSFLRPVQVTQRVVQVAPSQDALEQTIRLHEELAVFRERDSKHR